MGFFSSHGPEVAEAVATASEPVVSIPGTWPDLLREQIWALQQLTGNTEEEFLALGSQLHGFHGQAAEIVGSAQEMLSQVSGVNVTAASGELHELLGRMERFLGSIEEETSHINDAFSNILTLFGAAEEPLHNFRKINKILRMLGTATKIESARMGNKAAGFETLANDVAAMSVQVVEKASLVLEQKELLTATIQSSLQQMKGSGDTQCARVRSMLDQLRQDMGQLDVVNGRCATAVDYISRMSREMADGLSQVVMSMQFHDIVRQQIEHVHESLAEVIDHCAASGGSETAARQAIQETGDICELQAAQLQHAAGELQVAVGTITSNLRHVADETAGLSLQIGDLVGVADEAGSSFLLGMERSLAAVNTILAESAQANQELAGVMTQVTAKVREIALFVKEIAYIGGEVELIALNAQIKSARAGEEGAALGVLAEAIQRLSADTEALTAATSSILLQITTATEQLCSGIDADATTVTQDVSGMVAEVDQVMSTLKGVNQVLGSGAVAMHRAVDDLGRAIGVGVSSISVHETICQVAARVAEVLARMAQEAQELVPSAVGGSGSDRLKRLADRYTMQSERHVHEKITGLAGGVSSAGTTAPKTAQEDDGLGDNVELF